MGDEYQLRKDIDRLQFIASRLDGLGIDVFINYVESKLQNMYNIDEIDAKLYDIIGDQEDKIFALGIGIFNIRDDVLYVELPVDSENRFMLNSDGELVVEWDGENPFSIDDEGILWYDDGV